LLTVVLVYRAMAQLSERPAISAVLGSLVVASAPLFVTLGGYYLVESIQTLAVAWFILIMARAGRWDPAYTISHLLAAAAFACLTKVTTPLFCVWPGFLALMTAVRRWHAPGVWQWRRASVAAMAAASLCLSALAVVWYYQNWATVIAHARVASSGPVAAAWGREDAFLPTLWFWLQEVGSNFFLVPLAWPLVVLLAIVGICIRTRQSTPLAAGTLVAVLQIVTVLSVFALSSNRSARYLLPVLPYIAILVCWGVQRLHSQIVTGLSVVSFGLQLIVVYANRVRPRSQSLGRSREGRGLYRQGRDAAGVDRCPELS